MRLFGSHQEGQTGWSPEVQVQELRKPFHLPSERHRQEQPLRVVDAGQVDARADLHAVLQADRRRVGGREKTCGTCKALASR